MSDDKDDFSGISDEDLPTAPSVEPAGIADSSGTPPPPTTASRDKLSGIGTLFRNTLGVFKARFWTLFLITILTSILMIIGSAIAFVPILITPAFIPISVILYLILISYLLARSYPALYYAIPRDCGVIEAFKETKGRILSFLWIVLLQSSVIMGGYFLFIIPGIILSIWIMFSIFVFMEEDERGMNALLKSMAYVRGHGLSVFLRLLVLTIVLAVLVLIPIVGFIVSIICGPFLMIYLFLIYKELREIKGDFDFQPSRKWKIGFILIALLGPLVPIIIIITMIGAMGLTMLPMLMLGMTGMQKNMTFQMQQQDGNRTTTTRLNIQQSAPQVPGITNDIKTLLNKDNQSFERGQAAMKLGNSGNQKAAKSLIIALEKDDNWVVRQNAAEALGRLKAKNGVAALINILEQDDSVFVKKAAATALGEIGNKIAIGPLKKALKDPDTVSVYKQDGTYTNEKSVAIAAKEALQKMGVTATIQNPEKETKLIRPKALAKKTAEKTTRPATTTKKIKILVDTEKLATIAQDKSRSGKERVAAIKELRKNHDDKTMQVLIKALKDDTEWNVRQHATLALGKYSDNDQAVTAMKAALRTDKSVWVRRAGAQALKNKDHATISIFIDALNDDSDSGVRGYSAIYLGNIKRIYTTNALINALEKEKDPKTRVKIIKALVTSRDAKASFAIKKLLNDKASYKFSGKKEATVAEAAKTALATIKARKPSKPVKRWVRVKYSFTQLIKRSTNKGLPWVERVEAVRALGNSGKKAALPTLTSALKNDSEPFVRREAAIALGKLGDIRSFDELNLAIYDENQGVREEAYAALQKLLKKK